MEETIYVVEDEEDDEEIKVRVDPQHNHLLTHTGSTNIGCSPDRK